MQFEHWLTAQFASPSLVSFARVGEAITKHNLSRTQPGKNHFLNMLRTRREHQRQLRHRRKARSPRVQKQAPNFLAGISSAGFARNHNRKSLLAQFLRKARELGALAAPIQSFKGDEFAAPQCHASMTQTTGVVAPRPIRPYLNRFSRTA